MLQTFFSFYGFSLILTLAFNKQIDMCVCVCMCERTVHIRKHPNTSTFFLNITPKKKLKSFLQIKKWNRKVDNKK